MANSDQKEILLQWYNAEAAEEKEEEKINAVKQIFLDSGVLDFANEVKNQYYETAIQHLDMVSVTNEKKQILRAFAEDLLYRTV